jgi:GTPase SAR1 family protein
MIYSSERSIGLIGLTQSGKTTFLTSLLDHWSNHDSAKFPLGKSTANSQIYLHWNDTKGERRCHLEGRNEDNATINVVFDFDQYPTELLSEMFQMARCFREYERLDDISFSKKFAAHRQRMLELLNAFKSQQNAKEG